MVERKEDPRRARLASAQRKTYDALFRHPEPQDLAWGDVIELLRRLAEVREGRKGVFKVTRHGVLTTLRAPRLRLPLSADELSEVRSFLERSEEGGSIPVVAEDTRLLVAVEAHGARIFALVFEAGLPRRLAPFESNGYASRLQATTVTEDGPQPVRLGYYRDLARALRGAEEILLVAEGKGGNEALEALRAELRREHAELHRRLVGVLASPAAGKAPGPRRAPAQASAGGTPDDKLLARAREFYAGRGV